MAVNRQNNAFSGSVNNNNNHKNLELATNTTPENEVDNSSNILTSVSSLFNNPRFSDITLVVGSERFHAHKLLLATASDVFETMLTSDRWQDGNAGEITFHESEECLPVFSIVMRYIYTGKISLTMENVIPVLVLADKYNLLPLKESCAEYMASHLAESCSACTIVSWYQYAKTCDLKEFEKICCKFIVLNIGIVILSEDWVRLDKSNLMDFLRRSDMVIESEFALFNAVVSWMISAEHVEDIEENLEDIVPLIRFPWMKPQELSDLEHLDFVNKYYKYFAPHILSAYRYHAVIEEYRTKEKFRFPNSQLVCRNYTNADIKMNFNKKVSGFSNARGINYKSTFDAILCNSYADRENFFNCVINYYPKGLPFSIPVDSSAKLSLQLLQADRSPAQVSCEVSVIIYARHKDIRYVSQCIEIEHTFGGMQELAIDLLDLALLNKDSPYLFDDVFEIHLFVKRLGSS
ncbi:BTB/POZ domain-containing protein 17 isoform X2 [Lingula anatina]|nr:BTB/POZ domain-containing protein 17 isoform X2 [Lingula anatina]|eukprot:XP_013393274.1 BTB/POZ domain-containing protein 17 isoform X2 [Lingula anatina]